MGLTASTGALSGTPTTPGTYPFTVQVASAGLTATANLSIQVYSGLTVITLAVPDATLGFGFVAQLDRTGGTGPFLWTFVSGVMPPGLSLSTTGSISGTPLALGTYSFTVAVSSGDGQEATASLTMNVLSLCASQTQIPLAQCQALVAIYNATNGSGWTTNTGWTANLQPCTWFGVTCGGGVVTGLALSGNNLMGTVPTEVGDLTGLVTLRMDNNALSGGIPGSLGNLTSLVELALYTNQLTGGVPGTLGSMTSLVNLFLAHNQLSGSIPAELGSLPNLSWLSLFDNQLTGAIPSELGNLPSLVQLRIQENQLTGAIPTEIGNLTGLQRLYLEDNQLTGVVPLAVAQLGGQIQNSYALANCAFVPPGNVGLSIPDDDDYRAADLDGDLLICGLAVPPPAPSPAAQEPAEVDLIQSIREEDLNR
jgi:hypothetical protein